VKCQNNFSDNALVFIARLTQPHPLSSSSSSSSLSHSPCLVRLPLVRTRSCRLTGRS